MVYIGLALAFSSSNIQELEQLGRHSRGQCLRQCYSDGHELKRKVSNSEPKSSSKETKFSCRSLIFQLNVNTVAWLPALICLRPMSIWGAKASWQHPYQNWLSSTGEERGGLECTPSAAACLPLPLKDVFPLKVWSRTTETLVYNTKVCMKMD